MDLVSWVTAILGVVLGLIAVAVVVLLVGLVAGRFRLRRAARHHDGTYVGRIAEADVGEFDSPDAARTAVDEALQAGPVDGPSSGQVLARRHDGTWDVVDEVHVLG